MVLDVRVSRAGGARTLQLVGTVLGALALAACDKPEAPKEKPKHQADVELSDKALAAAALQTAPARAVPRRSTVTAAGTIDFVPSRVARIGTSLGGRVASVPVVAGQKIRRGATVVTVESGDLGRAHADELAARAHLQQTEAELAREQRLVDSGASSARALLAAETERNQASFSLAAATQRLRALGAGAGDSASSASSLTSPIGGTVLEVKARVGQPVAAAETLVVVGDIDEVWLLVDIYERDIGRVHEQDEVRVSVVAFPGQPFAGRVSHVGTVVDPERRVLQARVVLANPKGILRPGMAATARILGAADGSSLVAVPRGAIQSIDGQPFVFIERGHGKYELRAVEKQAELEGEVEIARGITIGEVVVVDGSFILKSEVLREQMGAND